jgi:hypothetical protein
MFCPKAPGFLAVNSLNHKLLGRISFWVRFKKGIHKFSVWHLDYRYRRSRICTRMGWACKVVVLD